MSRRRVRLQRGVGGGGVGDRRERGSVEPTSEGGWSCNRAAWLKTGRERRTTGGPGPREAHGAGLGGGPRRTPHAPSNVREHGPTTRRSSSTETFVMCYLLTSRAGVRRQADKPHF